MEIKIEIGQKITRAELIENGWVMRTEVLATCCEIWCKNTIRISWRVKTETIILLWDAKDLKKTTNFMLP